jgi:hypothetical protein
MKVSKDIGLVAAVLTLLHGLYIASYFIWVFVLVSASLTRFAPPVLNPLALALIDTGVYLFLGVGMLRGRRSYFVYAILWTVWGAVVAAVATTYKDSVLNLLSFLIVFSCTYYHIGVNKTNAEVAKKLGQFAGVLAVIQGIITSLAFTFTFILLFEGWMIPASPLNQLIVLGQTFEAVAAVTAVVYIVSGVGMFKDKREFFLLAISWTLIESALAVAVSSFARTHFNILAMLILAFGTYYYFSRRKT